MTENKRLLGNILEVGKEYTLSELALIEDVIAKTRAETLKGVGRGNGSPKIVCLCGSTRFGEAFQKAELEATLNGKIVLTIGGNMRTDTEIFGHLEKSELEGIKARLDELHLRKIDIADEVMILNVGGYIGNSTRAEIDYAESRGKPVKYLEALKLGKLEG